MKKTLIGLAIVAGLYSTSALAVVDLTANTGAVKLASELVVPSPAGLPLTLGTADDVSWQLGYNMNSGDIRYARIECTNNIKITAATITASANTAVGAVNGLGTNAINFSVTATANAASTEVMSAVLTNTLMAMNAVDCSYQLYDQPSQAQNGGSTGQILSKTGRLITPTRAMTFAVPNANTIIADVEAVPAFTKFTGNNNQGNLGSATLSITPGVVDATNTAPTIGGMITTASTILLGGDVASSATVFLSQAGGFCATPYTMNNTSKQFTLTPVPTDGTLMPLCYQVPANNTVAISASDFTLTFQPVSQAGWSVGASSALAAGKITRNGTELQATLAQIPSGYISRIALSNTGTVARPFTVKVLSDSGVTLNPGFSGSAAPGLNVFDVSSMVTVPSGAAGRAAIVLSIAGPDKEIQGMYQIVNPAAGSISNAQMARPGTN